MLSGVVNEIKMCGVNFRVLEGKAALEWEE